MFAPDFLHKMVISSYVSENPGKPTLWRLPILSPGNEKNQTKTHLCFWAVQNYVT